MTTEEVPTPEERERHIAGLVDLFRQSKTIGKESVPVDSDLTVKLARLNRALLVAGKLTILSSKYAARFGVSQEESAYAEAFDRSEREGS